MIATINKPKVITYFHCYKLNATQYALFDIKMDIPIVVGSYSIIKNVKLPYNSLVFSYELNHKGYFEKVVEKYIKIIGDGIHTKPPLSYNKIDEKKLFYHYFKLTSILAVLFDDSFEKPIVYGSNQKLQMYINQINPLSDVFYYKEDMSLKNSFKLWMIYHGNKTISNS